MNNPEQEQVMNPAPAEQKPEVQTEPKKTFSRYPLWARILSGCLAVLLFAQLWLLNASTAAFVREKFQGTEYASAADYVAENDEYLSASRLQQMRSYVQAIKTPRTYEEYSLCASVAIADEDYTKAAAYLEHCVEYYNGDTKGLAELLVKLGCVYSLNDKWDNARGCMSRATKYDATSASAWLMLAESSLRIGDYETAIDAMQTYGTLEPLTAEHLEAVATMQLGLERGADAVQTCTEALAMPDCSRTKLLYSRAQGYLMIGDTQRAEEDINSYLESGGGSEDVRLLQAICLDSTGHYDEALAEYRAIIAAGNTDLTLLEQALQCAYLVEDYSTMIELAGQGLSQCETDEQTMVFHKWMGVALLESGDYAESEPHLSAYINGTEAGAELYYLRGLCCMAQGKLDEAISDFTHCLDTESMIDECLYNRGLCYVQKGDAVNASTDFGLILIRDASPEIVEMTKELLELDNNE